MKMDVKNMIGMVVAVVIGIIMIGPLVAVVSDAQVTNGDPVTYTNNGFSDRALYVTEDLTDNHTMSLTANPDGKVIMDGVELGTASLGFYVVSDAITVCSTGAYMVITWGEFSRQYDANWGTTFEISWTNGTATIDVTTSGVTTTYTKPYTWIGYRVDHDSGNYALVNSTWNVAYTSDKDFIAMGLYSTGENDTYYTLYDGKLTLSEDYTGSVNATGTNVSGTTDVKAGTLSINVGDETFTPYIWAVAKEVHGHKDSGTMYDLLGIIPMLVTAGLIIGIAGAVFVRRLE